MQLNLEQQAAIACREGAWLWLATAGSGKTTVLTERVKGLALSGTPINEILALTFTTEAAKNMAERAGLSLVKGRFGFMTFHSFGLKVVEAEKMFLPFKLAQNIWESQNGSKIFRQVCKDSGMYLSGPEKKAAREFISKVKRAAVKLPDNFPRKSVPVSPRYDRIFNEYDKRMKEAGQIDYDDMIVLSVKLLENPGVRARWQYKYCLIDESQDTDNLQFRLVQLISEKHRNVFFVGDINQSLYSFRGATPENLERFLDWFPGGHIRILPENFRSTPEIVEFSRKAAPIKNQLVQNMRTANPSGAPIEVMQYNSVSAEINGVLEKCNELGGGKCAILARTNQQVGLFEAACTDRGIKFHLLGQSGFWKTPEIKNLLSLSLFANSSEVPDSYPRRLVAPLRPEISNLPADQAIGAIIEAANLNQQYANEEYDTDDNFALANLGTARLIATRFPNLTEFLAFANKASHASRKSKSAITLGTIHAAKGLEWDNVFAVGVEDGLLPHSRGIPKEEACIYYVAVSRPAKRLFISYVGRRSRFLE